MQLRALLSLALSFSSLSLASFEAAAEPVRREVVKRPVTSDAAGSGMMVFHDASGEDDSWLAPHVSNEVELEITGPIARARVTQVFENLSDETVNAVYVFPLPETAAVDGLTLKVGERRIVGEIRERESAQRTFEQAKRQGHTASLVAQQRPNLFTTQVANVGPHEVIEVVLHYQQDVRYDSGTFSLAFPSTLTPRYVPSAHEATDAARISPPFQADGDGPTLEVSVRLNAGFPLSRVTSASHELRLDESRVPSGMVDVALKQGLVLADRDFELAWQAAPGSAPRLTRFEEEHEGERYALLMLLPPDAASAPGQRLPRETSFIIDTSGSMSGTSIEQARAALESGLGALRASDRFNVIAFDSNARQLFDRTVVASPDNVARALAWVQALEADGGTEMISALELALARPPSREYVPQIVFVTDGSVGNEPEVFQFIRGHLTGQRLFTVGIGSAPNQYFMRGAARFGRGSFTAVQSTAEVGARMNELWSKLDSPLAGQLALAWKGSQRVEVWPERLPDLYAGEPLVVLAKLDAKTSGVELSGKRAGRAFATPAAFEAPAKQASVKRGEKGIHRLWARRKIEGLMDQMIEGRAEDEIRPEVTVLALRHGLLSKYTSFVAVDRSRSLEGAGRDVAVPSAVPAGNQMFGNMPQTATPAPTCLLMSALLFSAAWVTQRKARP